MGEESPRASRYSQGSCENCWVRQHNNFTSFSLGLTSDNWALQYFIAPFFCFFSADLRGSLVYGLQFSLYFFIFSLLTSLIIFTIISFTVIETGDLPFLLNLRSSFSLFSLCRHSVSSFLF